MIFSFFRRDVQSEAILSIYNKVVAQARLSCFYRDYTVADTVSGRFDLIVLHLALVLDRLAQDPALRTLGQGVFDRFCQDMDHNLREMGVGDLTVPKERMGEAFYGRQMAYLAALALPDDGRALVETVERNIYGGSASAQAAAARLAAYIRLTVHDLKGQDPASLAAGELRLPDPAAILATTGLRS